MMNIICIVIAACSLAGLAAVVIVNNRKNRELSNRLGQMIDRAAEGRFEETYYDESGLSFVEGRMSKFLEAGVISAKQVQAERDKIKELISDISHQTKTPIANIILYTQLMKEECEKDAAVSERFRLSVDELCSQGEKLSFLIESLVKTSRLETGIIEVNPRENSINVLINEVVSQIRAKADNKRVELKTEDISESIRAFFDMKWTVEALFNVVDNAVKYTPEGGRIFIRVIEYDMFVRVVVEDTGIGIAENEQGQIFGRFYRSKDVTDEEGVGIGLFLTREILSSQNGYVKVDSEKGSGSEFSLYIPKGLQ